MTLFIGVACFFCRLRLSYLDSVLLTMCHGPRKESRMFSLRAMHTSSVESPSMERLIWVTQLDPNFSIFLLFAHGTIAVCLVLEAFDQEPCDNCALSLAQLRGNTSTQAGGGNEKSKKSFFVWGSVSRGVQIGDDSNFDQQTILLMEEILPGSRNSFQYEAKLLESSVLVDAGTSERGSCRWVRNI